MNEPDLRRSCARERDRQCASVSSAGDRGRDFGGLSLRLALDDGIDMPRAVSWYVGDERL
jgi:hypothetical protein